MVMVVFRGVLEVIFWWCGARYERVSRPETWLTVYRAPYIRKLFQPPKRKSGHHELVFLGRDFDSLEMFLIITCLYIFEKLKDILKIMLRDDVNAWNDKEIQITYSRQIFDDEVIFWSKK